MFGDAAPSTERSLLCRSDPENPGWLRWQIGDDESYNEIVLGRMLVRLESDMTARVRIFPKRHLTNIAGDIHGATTLGLIDIAMFAALEVIAAVCPTFATTVQVSTQFIAAGDPAKPLDAVVELLRETRRMCFLRGLVEQDETKTAAFSGIIRKAS